MNNNNKSFSYLVGLLKNKHNSVKPDTIVEGVITNRIKRKDNEEYFLVNAGLKSDGILYLKDFQNEKDETIDESILPKIGDKIKLIIVKQDHNGKFILSFNRLKRKELLDKIKNIYDKNETIDVKISMELQDGYKVHIDGNIYGFLPFEDCLTDESGNVIKYKKDEEVKCVYISRFNKSHFNKIHVSLKPIEHVNIGDVVDCFVKEVMGDTVFLYIQNSNIKEGILHKTDIDFKNQNLLETKTENKVRAKIVSIDSNNKAILSIKKIVDDQWINLSWNVGDEIDCEIVHISDVGLVVIGDNGIEGFIHTYEVSWDMSDVDLREQFHLHQKIKAAIILLDKNKKQLKLSIKQMKDNIHKNPFTQFVNNHKVGDVIKEAVILKNYDINGILLFRFVRLIPGVDGRLNMREMDWNENIAQEMFDNLKTGQKIDVKITRIDTTTKRVYVSVKDMMSDTFDENIKKIHIGHYYNCEVLEASFNGLRVKLVDFDFEGFIKKHELDINSSVTWRHFSGQENQIVSAKLIGREGRTLLMSIKAKQRDEQAASMSEHCDNEPRSKNNITDLM